MTAAEGEFGKYQCFQFLLHILAAMTAGIHMLSLVTVAPVPEHRCFVPGVDTTGSRDYYFPNATQYIPMNGDVLDSCHMMNTTSSLNNTFTCSEWIYDDTYYTSSLAIEWDFVCNRRWMGAVAQSAYMFGVFTGAVTLGSLADKVGRKKVFYVSAVLQLVLGVVVSFIPEYYTFLVVRFLYGMFGSAGSYITAFVLTMELVGPSKRTACGIAFQASFALGMILVAFWGWLIPNYVILQAIFGLHSLFLIPHYWIMDESPRWLWAHGKADEAVQIVHRALKMNRMDHILDREKFLTKNLLSDQQQDEDEPQAGILSMVKTPNLRNRTFNIALNWFANSLAYYGLSLNTGALPGNPYLMLFLMSLMDYPSYAVTIYFLDRLGRRPIISAFMVLGGLACAVAAFIPQETSAGSITAITIVMAGKFFIAGSFAIAYNYTAEMFPTVVRNTALGVGSMCARLSGALTPLISLLDSFDKTIPPVIFGSIAVLSGTLALLLPETMNKPMPQSVEEGEKFGAGDTAFTSCCGGKAAKDKSDIPLNDMD